MDVHKFKRYITSIGNPQLEVRACGKWCKCQPLRKLVEGEVYRIAGDKHWLVRYEWVKSNFKKGVEVKGIDETQWRETKKPKFHNALDYRIKPDEQVRT